MTPVICCPQCQKNLKIAQPPRPGKRLICPKCGHRFLPNLQSPASESPAPPVDETPAINPELVFDTEEPAKPKPATPPLPPKPAVVSKKPLLLASIGAVLFIGACIAAAVYFTRSSSEPVATNPEPPLLKRMEAC